MTTLKELFENLGLDIKLPKVMEEYELFPTHPYTEYHTEKTENGEIIVFTGAISAGSTDMEAILIKNNSKFIELFIDDEDGSRTAASSIDKDGRTLFIKYSSFFYNSLSSKRT